VDDRGPWVAHDVRGDQGVLRNPANALVTRRLRLLGEDRVHLVLRRLPLSDDDDVGDRTHRDRRSDSDPVESVDQLGDRPSGGLCGTGGGGYQVRRAGPTAPETAAGPVDELL